MACSIVWISTLLQSKQHHQAVGISLDQKLYLVLLKFVSNGLSKLSCCNLGLSLKSVGRQKHIVVVVYHTKCMSLHDTGQNHHDFSVS